MIRRVFRLLICCVRHSVKEHRGGYRCFTCNPLRKHERKTAPLFDEAPAK